jgi:hypothetical protein
VFSEIYSDVGWWMVDWACTDSRQGQEERRMDWGIRMEADSLLLGVDCRL